MKRSTSIKKISLKTIQKNLLVISACVTIIIGMIDQVVKVYQTYSQRSKPSVRVLERSTSTSIQPSRDGRRYIVRSPTIQRSPVQIFLKDTKHWMIHNWSLVLILGGILIIILIIFLVNEIKEKIEENK